MVFDEAAEADLLARARAEEPAARELAFDDLFSRLRKQVFAVCLHVTGNAADADDALQETFMAVHAGLPRFRGESKLATWVHRIAVRAALRKRARRPAAVDVHELDPAERVADPTLQGEFATRLAAAMDRLSADHRVVISLFAVDGLRHAEIAAILGVPEGTVWSRLHLARKRLARELGG